MGGLNSDGVDFLAGLERSAPNSAWLGTMAEARAWVECASALHRIILLGAALRAMSPQTKKQFLAWTKSQGNGELEAPDDADAIVPEMGPQTVVLYAEAEHWAKSAHPNYLKAIAVAIYEVLGTGARGGFLRWARGV